MEKDGRRIVLDVPFERTVSMTIAALEAEGYELVSTCDVRDYLARTSRHDCRRYVLLSALLPDVTLDALQHDPELGPLLPVGVAVYELPDAETAVVASPALLPVLSDLGWRAEQPAFAALADRAGERLAHAFERLQHLYQSASALTRP